MADSLKSQLEDLGCATGEVIALLDIYLERMGTALAADASELIKITALVHHAKSLLKDCVAADAVASYNAAASKVSALIWAMEEEMEGLPSQQFADGVWGLLKGAEAHMRMTGMLLPHQAFRPVVPVGTIYDLPGELGERGGIVCTAAAEIMDTAKVLEELTPPEVGSYTVRVTMTRRIAALAGVILSSVSDDDSMANLKKRLEGGV
jgi:hypothetical protein